MRRTQEHINRFCSNCGSNKTYEYIRDGYRRYDWRKDKDGNILCKTCRFRLIDYDRRREYFKNIANPKTHTKWKGKWITYKDQRVYSQSIPRTGVCNLCRAVVGIDCKQTQFHHEVYDDNNPLANTIEICVSCHSNIRWGNI